MRTPSFQDDFHHEVEPALDEDCVWLKNVADKGETVYSPYVILALIDRIRSDREKVASMMMRNSIATGHGDTIDDLLAELEAHVRTAREQAIRECATLIEEGFDRGIVKKADTCSHDRYGWEDFEQCAALAILALLQSNKET